MIVDNAPEPAPNRAPGHEERDTNTRAILWFASGLIATIVVVLLLMKWAFHALPSPETESAQLLSARGVPSEPPPEPRLQVNAPEDLKKMREREDAILNSYGWVDRQNGIVRIPIERAMDLIAQRGLPPRTQTGTKPAGK